MRRFAGSGVVPGLAIGRAVLFARRGRALRVPVSREHAASEGRRLERARERSRQQLVTIRERLSSGPGADLAALFDAQLLMLDDPLLVGRALELVGTERVNAEWAVQQALDEVLHLFDGIDDPYLRDRRGDVADVAGRLRMNLREGTRGWQDLLAQGEGPFVLVADDPAPSVAAQLDWTRVAGLAIDAGSRTSHTAILARSLRLPTVVGLGSASRHVRPGDLVALDGTTGELLVSPDEAQIGAFERREMERRSLARERGAEAEGPALTSDAARIHLQANLDRLEDVPAAVAAGAEGVGLFRSEFLIMSGSLSALAGPASEAQQASCYSQLVAGMAPHPVTIRTFDLDVAQVDSPGSDIDAAGEAARHRPLGLRGIRLGLSRRPMLVTQLRAIARAAGAGPTRVLIPFVTTVAEVREARAVLDAVRRDLRAEGQDVPPIPLGVMIEVPAAALIADALAREADFLAIGTNDLAQYVLAADRTDDRVARVSEPFHPALLRILRLVTRLARRRIVPVSVCGEMASDPVLLALLVGLGVSEVSMTPAAIPGARRVVRASSRRELADLARRAVATGDLRGLGEYVSQALDRPAPPVSETLSRG